MIDQEFLYDIIGSSSCWDRLANCTSGRSSTSDISECCPLLKEEISDERECFCAAKSILLENPSNADSISQFLTLCSVSSFDTLCPGIHLFHSILGCLKKKSIGQFKLIFIQ